MFTGFCGWDAVGAELVARKLPAFWAGGFDVWEDACRHVAGRTGWRPAKVDATDVARDPTLIPEADIVFSAAPFDVGVSFDVRLRRRHLGVLLLFEGFACC